LSVGKVEGDDIILGREITGQQKYSAEKKLFRTHKECKEMNYEAFDDQIVNLPRNSLFQTRRGCEDAPWYCSVLPTPAVFSALDGAISHVHKLSN
jgi:hypothetical protein